MMVGDGASGLTPDGDGRKRKPGKGNDGNETDGGGALDACIGSASTLDVMVGMGAGSDCGWPVEAESTDDAEVEEAGTGECDGFRTVDSIVCVFSIPPVSLCGCGCCSVVSVYSIGCGCVAAAVTEGTIQISDRHTRHHRTNTEGTDNTHGIDSAVCLLSLVAACSPFLPSTCAALPYGQLDATSFGPLFPPAHFKLRRGESEW